MTVKIYLLSLHSYRELNNLVNENLPEFGVKVRLNLALTKKIIYKNV